MITVQELLTHHTNTDEFLACLEYTAAKTGFRGELIEKDFLCSLVLMHLYTNLNTSLIFKGGTSLAKVHTGFYRMSEDLDFSLSISPLASRKQRSLLAKPFKDIVNTIPDNLGIFTLEKPLCGTNESRQYNATLNYRSSLSPLKGTILVEIAIREEHQEEAIISNANTVLLDYLTEKPIVEAYPIKTFTKTEAYAEKLRAALARTQPAIRDFYDMHYALKHQVIKFDEPNYAKLVKAKLSIPETGPINLSSSKLKQLKTQIVTELLPTLQSNEGVTFELEELFFMLKEYVQSELMVEIIDRE